MCGLFVLLCLCGRVLLIAPAILKLLIFLLVLTFDGITCVSLSSSLYAQESHELMLVCVQTHTKFSQDVFVYP